MDYFHYNEKEDFDKNLLNSLNQTFMFEEPNADIETFNGLILNKKLYLNIL